MNCQDDLPSSDSEDADYCPVADSGSDSIDEKDEQLDEQDDSSKTKTKKRRKKVRRTRNAGKDEENDVEEQREASKTVAVDPEEEKKRVDALWADFLSGTEIPIKESSSSSSTKEPVPAAKKPDIPTKSVQKEEPKIFEFAGETVSLEKSDETKPTESSLKTGNAPTSSTNSLGLKRPSAGGLSSVLNQFSKKNKLSVLEKTKLDWDGFKSSEGIAEELKTHNKGRNGFLERRDFLERTDYKQFEIEKNLRMSSRRNK